MKEKSQIKLAVFHAFFSGKGGSEKFVFDLRNYFSADLFAGAINFNNYNSKSTDSFSKELFNSKYRLTFLHKDIELPLLRLLKRYFFFLFSKKIKELLKYDFVVFSGNVMFVQRRLRKLLNKQNPAAKPKLIAYCHTTPRKFTIQFEDFYNSAPKGFAIFFKIFGKAYLNEYIKDLRQMDIVLTNSENTKGRIKKFTGLEAKVMFPPVDTNNYKFISSQDYFLSYARLEELKRVPLIIEAFAQMPDKKLIICSTGPLHNWIEEQIETRCLNNISFEGFVTYERLKELIGNCYAGIYIPVDEDFGMTQIELMSAGKPVIGVKEGGLLETVLDGETGVLLPPNPNVTDLINAVKNLSMDKVISMQEKCVAQANKFTSKIFFERWEKEIYCSN